MNRKVHDAYFKRVFGQPRHARGMLRAVLPRALVRAIDWRTFGRCSAELVTRTFGQSYPDLLFQAAGPAGQLVFFDYEHQSRPHPFMPHRLRGYAHELTQAWLAGQPRTVRHLPLVVPVVLYHGKRRWRAPRTLEACTHPALSRPDGRRWPTMYLDDLWRVDDGLLVGRDATPLARFALLCLKHARHTRDLASVLRQHDGLTRAVLSTPEGRGDIAAALDYIGFVRPHAWAGDLEALGGLLGEEAEDMARTIAQALIEKGIEQGIEQGIETGQLRGRRDLVARLLAFKFPDLDDDARARVEAADAAQLDRWAERVLTASTLADVFEG